MSTIEVRTEIGTFSCSVGLCDCCSYCGAFIVWGTDRKGRAVALEPWGDGEAETETHFVSCNYLRTAASR